MPICKDCDGELQRSAIIGSAKRVNKDGRCPVCAEIDAEVKADDEAKLEDAARILARRRAS